MQENESYKTESDKAGDFIEGWRFVESMRGLYVLGKALGIAIEKIESLPFELQDREDLDDMRFIRRNVCGSFTDVTHVEFGYVEKLNKKIEALKKQKEGDS